MVVVAGVVFSGFLLVAAIGRFRVAQPGDLVMPLAVTAVLAGLGVIGHAWLSDHIGWALPLAVVALVALLLGALTPLDVRFPSPLPMGAVALAVVVVAGFAQPLTAALHPPAELLPRSDDAEVVIRRPAADAAVTAGSLPVEVEVRGGSIGPGGTDIDALPADPEVAGELWVTLREVVDGRATGLRSEPPVDLAGDCPLTAPCEQVSFTIPAEPGTWQLTVELLRGDGTPLAPSVQARTRFTAS